MIQCSNDRSIISIFWSLYSEKNEIYNGRKAPCLIRIFGEMNTVPRMQKLRQLQNASCCASKTYLC